MLLHMEQPGLALRWADVRLDRCELSIKGSLTRRGRQLVVSDAKSQRSRRVVSLSLAMVRLITEQRAEQVAERPRAGNLWEDTGFVFATEFGSPVDPRTCCGRRRCRQSMRDCRRSASTHSVTPTPPPRC